MLMKWNWYCLFHQLSQIIKGIQLLQCLGLAFERFLHAFTIDGIGGLNGIAFFGNEEIHLYVLIVER